jgi:ketosteroid isomerase-like protein
MRAIPNPLIEQALTRYYAALNARDFKSWSALFAKDATIHEPVGTPYVQGEAQLREAWQVLTGPFEQLEVNADDIFYAGAGAAVHWSATAKSKGAEVEFEGITVFEIGDGESLVLTMSWWDPAEVLIRLADSIAEE